MMNNYLLNNKIYEIQANNQLSVILSQFDANFIMDVIEDTITMRLNNFDLMPAPNAVQAFESNFLLLYDNYPNEQENIDDSRERAYREIIGIICNRFKLQFEEQINISLYTLAYYLYDFFISKFNSYIVKFYLKFLEQEKYNIYKEFNLDNVKKNKDVATSYSKMFFQNDDMMGLIVANLPTILSGLRHLAVTDNQIYRIIYDDNQEIVDLFESNISALTPIFNTFNSILFNEIMYPTIITHIKIAIQQSHLTELVNNNQNS